MPRKPRLKSTTIWALEDVIAICIAARPLLLEAVDRAEQQLDPVQLARLARDARQGRYNGRDDEDDDELGENGTNACPRGQAGR